MLGHKLVGELKSEFDVWTTLRGGFDKYQNLGLFGEKKTLTWIDVENENSVAEAVKIVKPEVIVNAVGIIKQLSSSRNVIKTIMVNSIFPHRLAEIAGQTNSRLITISTDCVFDGKKGNYIETDLSDAADLYGKSKNLGEVDSANCLTIRTSIIGRELETSHSLVEWFLNQREKKIKGFVNAIYTGFPTIVLSEIISGIIKNFPALNGLYHVSSEPISKFELLTMLRDEFEMDVEVEPFEDFYMDRSLDSGKFRMETGFKPEDWKTMLKRLAADEFPYAEIREKLLNRNSESFGKIIGKTM